MIDFHSHVLPGIDDGSKSLEESLKMLEMSAEQGVTVMAMTPHFYADCDTPEKFLARRFSAYEKLKNACNGNSPKLLLGAEVSYFPGIHRSEAINCLKLEGTDLFLLEMPYAKWSDKMLEEIHELNQRQNMQVVLAHIDRYLSMQKPKVFEELLQNGLLFQANADCFTDRRRKRRALKMIKNNWVTFLGSDCHNITSRPPCLDKAAEAIKEKFGDKTLDALNDKSRLSEFGR